MLTITHHSALAGVHGRHCPKGQAHNVSSSSERLSSFSPPFCWTQRQLWVEASCVSHPCERRLPVFAGFSG